eukprot:jgi/Chrzof1/12920/Cz07g12110.t1
MSCTSHVNTPGTVAFLPLANPGTILHGPSTPSPAVPLASRPLHILDSSGSLADELEELHVLHDRHVLCNQSGRQTQAPLGPVAHLDPEFQQECQAFASVPWSEPPAEAFNPDVDGPLLVRVTPGISQVVSQPLSQYNTIPINDISQPVAFETELFKGKIKILLRGVPSTPMHLFEGKRRNAWVIIQGSFKRPVNFNNFMLGSEFTRPFNLPRAFIIAKAILWVAHKLGGAAHIEPAGDHPTLLAPIISAAQVVNVSDLGSEPDMLIAQEDMTLFSDTLAHAKTGEPWSENKRRKYFRKAAHRAAYTFDTSHVWTFHVYDMSMDYEQHKMMLPFHPIDMVKVLDRQPIQYMLKDVSSGAWAMHFELWHQRMLNKHEAAEEEHWPSSGPQAQA